MKKWNKIKEEKMLSESERKALKETVYRILVENDVGIAYVQDGEIKVAPIWDYACMIAGIRKAEQNQNT